MFKDTITIISSVDGEKFNKQVIDGCMWRGVIERIVNGGNIKYEESIKVTITNKKGFNIEANGLNIVVLGDVTEKVDTVSDIKNVKKKYSCGIIQVVKDSTRVDKQIQKVEVVAKWQ